MCIFGFECNYLHAKFHSLFSIVQLHSWARFVGILLSVAGAIEVALTGADDESSYITPANGSNSTDPGESTLCTRCVSIVLHVYIQDTTQYFNQVSGII